MKTLWSKVRYGFTLIELLVVITIIGILMTMVLPAVNKAILQARLTKMTNDGKKFVESLSIAGSDSAYTLRAYGLPLYGTTTVVSNNVFANTRDYFVYAVTQEIMAVNWNFFAGPGIVPAKDAAGFTGTNHAWRLVGDVTEGYPETAPVMFTKNLSLTTLGEQIIANASGTPDKIIEIPPFGTKGVVVITKGFSGIKMLSEDLKLAIFTNIFLRSTISGQTLTNRVLVP